MIKSPTNVLFPIFQDYFTVGFLRPPLDLQQDWVLTRFGEENGKTTLMFYRQRNTTDQRDDIAIEVNNATF